MKKFLKSFFFIIAVSIFIILSKVFLIMFFCVDFSPLEQTEFENIDAFWDMYPCRDYEIAKEITDNATDIKYYAYEYNYGPEVYGVSMLLDAKDYEKLKNSYSGDFELSFYNGNKGITRKIQHLKNIESFMISEQGKIGLGELISDNIEDYEIFYFNIDRNTFPSVSLQVTSWSAP